MTVKLVNVTDQNILLMFTDKAIDILRYTQDVFVFVLARNQTCLSALIIHPTCRLYTFVDGSCPSRCKDPGYSQCFAPVLATFLF